MLLLAWTTFRERWQVFAGAIVTVCVGVALVQSSLLILISAATARVPPGLPESEARALREGYEGAISLLGLVLALAAFVAVFIVGSTFAFAVAQRRRDLALLRLTGASRRQVRSLLVGEAVLLGLVGSGLGVVLGLTVMRLQVWMLDRFGFVPPGFSAQWRSWVVWVSVGTGVLIAVLGVLTASRRASRIRPLEALRESAQAAAVMTASRWIVGLVFTSGGVLLLTRVPGMGVEAALPLSMLVSMVLVVGFSAFAPLIVPLVGRLLGLGPQGALGELVWSNLRSDARRSASTAAPIMLLIAFVAGIGGTLTSITEADRQETLRTVQGDLVVTTDVPAASELAGVAGVDVVSAEVEVPFEIRRDEGEGGVWWEPGWGQSVDPAAYTATHDVAATAGDLADLHGDAVAVSPSAAPERDPQVGDTVYVRLDGEDRELRIVALLPETLSGPFRLLSSDVAPPEAAPWRHMVRLAEGADANGVADRLAEFGEVATVEQWIDDRRAENDRVTMNVMVSLLGLTTLYTIIAMVNAVVISASDRRGEFATARVTGLTRGQVVRMAFWESQAVVVIGLLLGGLAAAGTVLGNVVSIRDLTGVTVVGLPWALLTGLALGAAAVVGATSVLTTLSATRAPPIRWVAARE